MKITVKLFAYLKDYLPSDSANNEAELELGNDTTIEGLIRYLKIPEDTSKVIFVNGVQLEQPEALKDGDVVNIFPFA